MCSTFSHEDFSAFVHIFGTHCNEQTCRHNIALNTQCLYVQRHGHVDLRGSTPRTNKAASPTCFILHHLPHHSDRRHLNLYGVRGEPRCLQRTTTYSNRVAILCCARPLCSYVILAPFQTTTNVASNRCGYCGNCHCCQCPHRRR